MPSRRRSRSRRPATRRSRSSPSAPTAPPTPSARPSRWARTRPCTSTTRPSTGRTPSPPPRCWRRPSARSATSTSCWPATRPPTAAAARWPAMLGELLGWPSLTHANALTVENGTASVKRETDEGTCDVTASLPAVVSVGEKINEPRYPSFKGIMAAKKKPVSALGISRPRARRRRGRPGRLAGAGRLVRPAPAEVRWPEGRGRGRRRPEDRRVPRRPEAHLIRPTDTAEENHG